MLTNLKTVAPISLRLPRTLWLTGFSHFTLELCHSFMPVLYPLLLVSMALSYTQIGVLTLAISLTSSLLQPFCSTLSERFGAGRVVTYSVLWLGGLMSIVSLAPNYSALIVLLTVASLGSAAFHPAGAELVSTYGVGRRGLSMSIFSVSGNLGAALSPLLIALSVGGLGLHAALTILPVAIIGAALLYTQLGRSDGSQSQRQRVAPALTGQPFRLGLILIVVSAMTRSWFQVSLTTYLPAWVESTGGTLSQGSALLSLLLFSLGVGSLLGGPLADRFSAWQVTLFNTLLIAPIYWFFLATQGVSQLVCLSLLGIVIGSTYPTAIMMAQDAWPHRTAFAAALVMGWGWVPGGLGASFIGYVADQRGLESGLHLLITPPLIGALCILAYQWGQRRRKSLKV